MKSLTRPSSTIASRPVQPLKEFRHPLLDGAKRSSWPSMYRVQVRAKPTACKSVKLIWKKQPQTSDPVTQPLQWSLGGSSEPVALSHADRSKATTVCNDWGLSIDAYEESLAVSAFSSKFDAYLAGHYTLTADELAGSNLFRGKGNCNSCHLDGRSTAPSPTATTAVDTGTAADTRPMFTCLGSANLGEPKNPVAASKY